jgi:hypothetical protein
MIRHWAMDRIARLIACCSAPMLWWSTTMCGIKRVSVVWWRLSSGEPSRSCRRANMFRTRRASYPIISR